MKQVISSALRLVLLTLCFALVPPPSPTFACTCAPQTPDVYFRQADRVFAGRVLEERIPDDPMQEIEVVYEVLETYKGPAADTIVTYTDESSSSCRAPRHVGVDYLVYATMWRGRLGAGLCSGTKTLGFAQEDYRVNNLSDSIPGLGPLLPADLEWEPAAADADFIRDQHVDIADFQSFAAKMGSTDPLADLDRNGIVNFRDFLEFIRFYGQTPRTGELHNFQINNQTSIDFVYVEPGRFRMGATPEEQVLWESTDPLWSQERVHLETPAHMVVLSKGFYLSRTEVTQRQWRAVMHNAPWSGTGANTGADRPAVEVRPVEVLEFVDQLNLIAGDSLFRLPTEAEWEYAARAKTVGPWWFGSSPDSLSTYEWVDLGYQEGAHEVATKLPNPWGLFDMLGNVAEYTGDVLTNCYIRYPRLDPEIRRRDDGSNSYGLAYRGGSFGSSPYRATACVRDSYDTSHERIGFRLVMIEK